MSHTGLLTTQDPIITQLQQDIPSLTQLYWSGNESLLHKLEDPSTRKIAIIGTQHASTRGVRLSRQLGYYLDVEGTVIISGVAPGIDAACHRGSLNASGSTIAVLPCGIDQYAYVQTQKLQQEIGSKGLLLSEYSPSTTTTATRRLQRDRIQAALADLIILVESERGGGAMQTVEDAASMGKRCIVIEFSDMTDQRTGNLQLLQQGYSSIAAQELLNSSNISDLLDL